MENKKFYADCLLKWLKTFQPNKITSLNELSDGVAIASTLHQIAPEWFTDAWLATINAAPNWRVKVSNLRKLLTKLMDYYQECLGFQLTDFSEPDITKIATGDDSDLGQIIQLLQLVLGCAVHCINKEEYISTIMNMEEVVQQVIMQSIQDLASCTQELGPNSVMALESAAGISSGDSLSIHLRDAQEELRQMQLERDQMAQRCHELDSQVVQIQDEKACYQSENKKLQDRLKELEGIGEIGATSQRLSNKELKTCQEELFKAETARDDYHNKVKQLERDLMDLQARQLELQQASEEARLLKDEVDILREAADKAAKHEATIESYKKKLEEFSDLKRRYKLLEDKNLEYMQNNIELEEEVKKSGSFKPQVEMYKKQVSELHQKLEDETKRVDKMDFENRKLVERLQALSREKERLVLERDQLKETLEELKFSQLQQLSTSTEGDVTDSTVVSPTAAGVTPADNTDPLNLKEKLIRLEHENRLLRQRGLAEEGSSTTTAILQSQVDDLTERMSLQQAENRRVNQRVLELENQLSEAREGAVSRTEEVGASSLKQQQQLQSLHTQLQQLTAEVETKGTQLEEKDALILDYKQKLARKDAEILQKEEKYKKCIDKAKSVIKTLDPKQTNGSPEVAELRSQIQEKEKIIASLEKEYEKGRGIQDMEEKLLITAFNRYAVQLHRQAAEQRLSQLGASSTSFLSRQRQPAPRRLATHPSPSSNVSTRTKPISDGLGTDYN